MKVEYKPNTEAAMWWVFYRPSGVDVPADGQIGELEFDAMIEAIGVVRDSVLVKYSRDVSTTSAGRALNAVSCRLGFDRPFGAPIQLDKAHLQSWGFYWSDEKVQEIAESLLEVVEGKSIEVAAAERREEVDARTAAEEEARKKAADCKAAGQLLQAKEWEENAQKHAQRLSVLSTQLRLLTPGGLLMLEAPEGEEPVEPSSGSQDLCITVTAGGLDERIVALENREEKLKEHIAASSVEGIVRWIYGTPDKLICYVKPKMSIQQRLRYILSKNPSPTPVEFAKLFMEINTSERCVEPGRNALIACKVAHKKHDARFSFDALPTSVQEEYRAICYSWSSCAVCGKAVADDKVHCSKKCASESCVRCDGPMERFEEERQVHNRDRDIELSKLQSILQAKGVCEPVTFKEQLAQYHDGCKGKVSCFSACDQCQGNHDGWRQQHADWKAYGREPESFWTAKEARLAVVEKMDEKKTIVEVKRRCAAGCTEDEPAQKRRRR